MKPLYTQFKEQQKNMKYKAYSITNSGWYRIGEFNYNLTATAFLSFGVKAGSGNIAGILGLVAVKGFNKISFEKILRQALEGTRHFTKFRLVLKNYSISYIEAYKSTETSATLLAKLSAEINTELYDAAEEGNVPEGYSTIELEL